MIPLVLGGILLVAFFASKKKSSALTDPPLIEHEKEQRQGVVATTNVKSIRVISTGNPAAEFIWQQNTPESTSQWGERQDDFYLSVGEYADDGTYINEKIAAQIGRQDGSRVFEWYWEADTGLFRGIALDKRGEICILTIPAKKPVLLPDGVIRQ